eukprot:m.52792 g.52792  ORF g.52792 m.52792 type:complete len:127 (-) comp12329_c0_seq2:75-455(-)
MCPDNPTCCQPLWFCCRSFDIANHFCEWAGGTVDGVPRYEHFPSAEQQRHFCKSYLAAANCGTAPTDAEVQALVSEVGLFVLIDHWYWALWAINQAAAEGTLEFPYLLYAKNRVAEFKRQAQAADF